MPLGKVDSADFTKVSHRRSGPSHRRSKTWHILWLFPVLVHCIREAPIGGCSLFVIAVPVEEADRMDSPKVLDRRSDVSQRWESYIMAASRALLLRHLHHQTVSKTLTLVPKHIRELQISTFARLRRKNTTTKYYCTSISKFLISWPTSMIWKCSARLLSCEALSCRKSRIEKRCFGLPWTNVSALASQKSSRKKLVRQKFRKSGGKIKMQAQCRTRLQALPIST